MAGDAYGDALLDVWADIEDALRAGNFESKENELRETAQDRGVCKEAFNEQLEDARQHVIKQQELRNNSDLQFNQ